MATGGELLDVIVIGGGQSALTEAYFLKRAKLTYVMACTDNSQFSLAVYDYTAWAS